MAATIDFYDTLGVSRTSEDVVIRAAYLALMRRYHPDGNPSSEAAERVRSITTAYAVLGDPAKRRDYDRASDCDGRHDRREVRTRARAGPLLFAATMLCMAVLILVIWAGKTPGDRRTAELAAAARVDDASGGPGELDCLSERTKALVAPELLRRAASLSRATNGNLARLSGAISVRTSPALTISQPHSGFVECAAWVTVEGRPEQTAGNAAPLLGNVEFTVGAGEDGGVSLVEFKPDDRFLIELASLGQASSERGPRPDAGRALAEQSVAPDRPAPAPKPVTLPRTLAEDRQMRSELRPSKAAAAPIPERARRPMAIDKKATLASAPCRSERGRESSCVDDSLTLLDQQLGLFERQSLANASAGKREALVRTQARFEAGRKKCDSAACTRKLILSRTREIADIMGGAARSQP